MNGSIDLYFFLGNAYYVFLRIVTNLFAWIILGDRSVSDKDKKIDNKTLPFSLHVDISGTGSRIEINKKPF